MRKLEVFLVMSSIISIISFLYFFFISKSIIGMKLSIFILFSSAFLVKFIFVDDIYSSKMGRDGKVLKSISHKLDDIKKGIYYQGRKKKESANFFIGIIVGLGISLITEALIELIMLNNKINSVNSTFNDFNITLKNLTGMNLVNYKTDELFFLSSDIVLFTIILFGFGILLIAIAYYFYTNRGMDETEELTAELLKKIEYK